MKKRVLSLVLAVVLVCALAVPAEAFDMGKAGEYNIISAGDSHTAAIDENGSLWMWGDNSSGALGDGTGRVGGDVSKVPIKVMDGVSSVSCGDDVTAAIKTDGSLWMWGNNWFGQLGNGTTNRANRPVKVMDNVAAVSGASGFGAYTAAIKTDGTLWMWGHNENGELGNGGQGNAKYSLGHDILQTVPVKVMDNVAEVNCMQGGSGNFTMALKTDGTLWTWGYNARGQLGNGTTKMANRPVKVLDNVIAMSGGGDYAAAIKSDGTLWTWGDNAIGQLGNGSTSGSNVPVKVMDNVAAVRCGGGYTAALKTDGTLWTWGQNDKGSVGNGGVGNATINNAGKVPIQTVPVKIMENVAEIGYRAAIKKDGTLWTWGDNYYGQVGNGTTKQVNSPVKVLDNVAAIDCGIDHRIAVKTNGTLWTWGDNAVGELGNGGGGNGKSNNGPIQTVPIQITLGGASMPTGVRLHLNGGLGGSALWTDSTKTVKVPTNPIKPGYTFGGWYTDAALTTPWNFNDKVVNTLTLYAKWVPVSSTATKTGKSQSIISLNGNAITLDAYTLKAANGGDVTYVKLRDIAALLESTSAKFNVDWKRGAIYVASKSPYTTKNGTELKAISGTDGSYKWNQAPVLFDGTTKPLEGIVITDGKGGGHTFFKLRDLGEAIGFTVGWTAQRGIFIETK